MRTTPLAALFCLFASVSVAADNADPVREVMAITEANWNTVDSDWKYIFDADPLSRLFSKEFQAAYVEAAKKPAYDTENGAPGDPFGYDVITASQDGCPLKEIKIGTAGAPTAAGIVDIPVSFKMWTCIEEDEIKNSVSELHFDVTTEDGRPVINDIHRVADGERDSVLDEMRQLAKAE